MQFRVPQFIDMEDKIIGPLTLKQFGYVVGAGGVSFIIWTFIPIKILAILLIIPIAGLFLALAFVKHNNRSFGEFLENAFAYYTNPKVYTWKQPTPEVNTNEANIDKIVSDTTKQMIISKTDRDRIHDLSLGLDVLDNNIPKEEK
ncbi:MAG: PrgI family protein [Candidatus Pacebacteria bacterium]|nr:PrgI family protein [Candidatus Paceibacterota bacterium]MBP9866682.1 PrgI family protein [Candidatus Paceibacterota bacterium]